MDHVRFTKPHLAIRDQVPQTVLAGPTRLIAHGPRACRRYLPASETLAPRRPAVSQRGPAARSRRMPRELLDARHDLSEQEPCQVTFGELQSEVPGMSDEASDPTQRHPNVEGHLLSWLKVGLQVAHCAPHVIHPGVQGPAHEVSPP